MKGIKKYQSIALALIMAVGACREERDLTYQGPKVVEFSNPITGTNSKLMGASIGGGTGYGDNPEIPIKGDRDSVVVQLVGEQLAEAFEVQYDVEEGSAVEGVDYEFISERGVIAFAPFTSSAAIYLRLLNKDTDPAAVKNLQLILRGTSRTDVSPSANYSVFSVNIYPMNSYLDRSLTSTNSYFSLADGESYPSSAGNPSPVDLLFNGSTATLESPEGRSTTFSQRLFIPGNDVPEYLQASYVTLQLNNANSTTINALPTTGTTANAVVNSSVALLQHGVYAFQNSEGKKGYIRIKTLSSTAVDFDVMVQP